MTYSSEVLADSPLAYYRLGESSTGLLVNDGSTATEWVWGAAATPARPALLSDGGYAAAPSGSAELARSTALPTGIGGTAVTAEAWVKIPAANVAGAVVKIGNSSNGWGFGVGGSTWDDAGKQLIVLIEGLVWRPTGYNFGTGTYHVAVVRSGSSFECFVNGSSVATVSWSTVNTPTQVAMVGGSGTSRNLPSSVDIDNVAIFTSSLSSTRIAAHYDSGAGDNAEVAADSPAVWLKFDEPTAAYLVDSSGNSRHGAYISPPALGVTGLVAGDADTAADFDGSADRASVSYGAWMTLDTFTVEAVIEPDALAADAVFLSRHDSVWCTWELRLNSDGKIVFRTMPTSGNFEAVETAASSVSAGQTAHVAVTYNLGAVTIYLDGVSAATGTLNKSESHNRGFFVGATGHPQAFFNGTIDEVALYGSALSAARIATHADLAINGGPPAPSGALAATLPTPTVGLVGSYVPPPVDGTLAATLPVPAAALAGTYTEPGVLAAGALAVALPVPSTALTGTYDPPVVPVDGSLAAVLPAPTVLFAGAYTGPGADASGTLAAVLPAATLALAGRFYARNGYGLVLDSETTVDAEAPLPVTPSDTGTPALVLHVITPTVPTPVLVNGRPS